MDQQEKNRSVKINLRLTPQEYEQIVSKWKASNCRKLSEYLRRIMFDKPVQSTYRNQSMDDVLTEQILLRKDLNRVGNNFNQAVKKLHALRQISEFKNWLLAYENDEKELLRMIGEINNHIEETGSLWLQ